MWDDPGPVDVPRIEPLLEALAAAAPTPGSGSAAALAGSMAAAVCAKVARIGGEGGASAQAVALCWRLTALAEEDARLFRLALDELDRRDDDFVLGRALMEVADALLRIAEACADVAALAAALAASAPSEQQPDARSAGALAAGAAHAATVLVEANLGVTPDDERLQLARRLSERARALSTGP
jgi:formiminotetrahydrofolate cyclodeaminase